MQGLSTIKRAIRHRRRRRVARPARSEARLRKRAEKQAVKAEARGRAAFLAQAAPMTPYVAVEVGGAVFFVSTRDEGVGRQVFVGRWRKDLTVLARAIEWLAANEIPSPEHRTLVDVGANIGTTTVMALRRHGFDTAVAIEPSPENSRLLRLNVAANDLDGRVRPLQAAASDREGRLWLDVSNANFGGHRIAGESEQGTVAVEVVTLDGLVATGVIDPERVGLVWVDAQGHEPAVLAGASRFVEAGVPMVVAIRQVKGDSDVPRPWVAPADTRDAILESLRGGYTDVVELRKRSRHGRATHPVEELDTLVDSFRHCQDLLFVRRG